MRIIFAGTPQAAVPSLRALASTADIACVLTRTDAPVGRRRVLTPSPVAAAAEELALPVHKTNRFDVDARALVTDANADLGVVVAFGAIIPDEVLAAPRLGWVNLHFSLLPRWRGAAPTQRSIAAGEPTGVSVVRVVTELDAGPVFRQRAVDLGAEVTGSEALDALAREGATDLAEVVAALGAGTAGEPSPQTGDVTYAHKLSRADGKIDWSQPVDRVYDLIRAMTSEPGAWALDGDDPLKVIAAGPSTAIERLGADKEGLPGRVVVEGGKVFVQCADGFVPVTRVQPAGKPAMDATAWVRGKRDRVVLR